MEYRDDDDFNVEGYDDDLFPDDGYDYKQHFVSPSKHHETLSGWTVVAEDLATRDPDFQTGKLEKPRTQMTAEELEIVRFLEGEVLTSGEESVDDDAAIEVKNTDEDKAYLSINELVEKLFVPKSEEEKQELEVCKKRLLWGDRKPLMGGGPMIDSSIRETLERFRVTSALAATSEDEDIAKNDKLEEEFARIMDEYNDDFLGAVEDVRQGSSDDEDEKEVVDELISLFRAEDVEEDDFGRHNAPKRLFRTEINGLENVLKEGEFFELLNESERSSQMSCSAEEIKLKTLNLVRDSSSSTVESETSSDEEDIRRECNYEEEYGIRENTTGRIEPVRIARPMVAKKRRETIPNKKTLKSLPPEIQKLLAVASEKEDDGETIGQVCKQGLLDNNPQLMAEENLLGLDKKSRKKAVKERQRMNRAAKKLVEHGKKRSHQLNSGNGIRIVKLS